MRKFLIVLIAFLFGVMTGTCTLDVAKGDDFSDLVAQLEAKNAKKPVAKAACTCGPSCPCAAGECGDAACPTAAKVAQAKAKKCLACDGKGYIEEADLNNPGKWIELTCDKCKGTGKVSTVKPTRAKPSADEPGNPWQWATDNGGYWWKWKNGPPSLGVESDPFAAANCANGQCGSQWTAANGVTYWTSAPAVSEYSSGRRGVFRGGFRSGGGGCGAGG